MPRALALRPSLDLIFRLFCLGQLFVCIRPFIFEGAARHYASGGFEGALLNLISTAPPSSWAVYALCAAVLVVGPRTALLVGLAGAHVLDVSLAAASNSLTTGYAEKGFLVFVCLGAALLSVTDKGSVDERSDRMRSLLRALAGVAFAMIALNKFNADFLDPVTSCARSLNGELARRITFAAPLAGLLDSSPWISFLMEAIILPLLLIRPRIGVLYVWGFFTGVALVGPRGTCLVFMVMSLCFLPPQDFRLLQKLDRRAAWVVLGIAGLSALFWVLVLNEAGRVNFAQLFSRVLFLSLSMGTMILLAWNIFVGEAVETTYRSAFRNVARPARIAAWTALVLFGINELAPHVGLKSKYSLTMWSNLRSDGGRTNSYVFPEAMRVFPYADRSFLEVSRVVVPRGVPAGAAQPGAKTNPLLIPEPFMAMHTSAQYRLRELEYAHGAIEFEIVEADGVRSFDTAREGSAFAQFVAAEKPTVDFFDQRLMTLNTPQHCLGP